MGYLGYKPADKPLTAADITDGIITSAKITDATIVNGDIANSTIALAKLSTTGTASSSNYLRGDGAWTAVSSDYVLLATTDASSSASVSFDGYFSSTYKNYELILSDILPVTNNVQLQMRFRKSNADITTSNYRAVGTRTQTVSGGGSIDFRYQWNTSSIEVLTNSQYNVATQSGNGRFVLFNPLGTSSHKKCTYTYHAISSDGGTDGMMHLTSTMQLVDNANALSGITFYMSSGNIASGNFKLYGIK